MCFRQRPEIEHENMDSRFQEFVQTTLDSPGFKELQQTSRANRVASEMATMEFANQYAKMVRKDQERSGKLSNNPTSKQLKKEQDAADLACHAAVNAALTTALQEVEQFDDAQEMLGMGKNAGTDGTLDMSRMMGIFQKVKTNSQLKRICELAGRYRRVAQSKQRQKVVHGYDEMVGVELSGDVSRLLPVELSRLTDPNLELDIMRRLVEKQCMSRQYRGVDNEAKGPIVICVDESGSTSGDVVCQEKAFALSMYWIARHQRRWCWLVSFASAYQKGSDILIPPNRPEPAGLVTWLEHFYGGGTDLEVPLMDIPNQWSKCPKGRTDMVIITDGMVDLPMKMKENFLEFKKREKVKLTTIVVGANPGHVAEVSDNVHVVNKISVDSKAIEECMSI